MTTYKTYRNGGGTIQARIKLACQLFYKDRKALPLAVVVNPTEERNARAACTSLGLSVPVESSKGVLIPEVWLELAD